VNLSKFEQLLVAEDLREVLELVVSSGSRGSRLSVEKSDSTRGLTFTDPAHQQSRIAFWACAGGAPPTSRRFSRFPTDAS
jgi:hypothetical protein